MDLGALREEVDFWFTPLALDSIMGPAEGETDVATGARIRMQLSRDLNADTLKGRLRFTPEVEFTMNYTKENRALEIRITNGLPPFKPMKMEILDGVKGTDGGAMKPFTLTFTTGS